MSNNSTSLLMHSALERRSADHISTTRQESYEQLPNSVVIERNGRLEACFHDHDLMTALQPIYSLAHKRPVGYEALLRAVSPSGAFVPPPVLFSLSEDPNDLLYLDRVCRTLHVGNFQRMPNLDPAWLFLNLNPSVMLQGRKAGSFFTPTLLKNSGVGHHRVVVEILEKDIEDDALLVESIDHYRNNGCLIAIDDFGAGSSNFDRIWKLKPDIVKLDRSIITHAEDNIRARRILPSLVSLIHQAGCLVLLEGIETETQALITMDADVDFVQGYYFAKPVITPEPPDTLERSQLHHLSEIILERDGDEHIQYLRNLSNHLGRFWEACHSERPLAEALSSLLEDSRIERCYILDENGVQQHENLTRRRTHDPTQPNRFAPIAEASNADWSRRTYFRRAKRHPGEIQITGPYLSLPDARMCVTLSLAVTKPESGGHLVACADIEWTGNSHADLITSSVGPWGERG